MSRYGRSNSAPTTASIESQLREQILHQVDKLLIQQPPSRQSLQQLLRLATPSTILQEQQSQTQQSPSSAVRVVDNPVAREKAFRQLKGKLHPDKHARQNSQRVTELFQNVQTYYVDCCHAMAADEESNGNGNGSRSGSSRSHSKTSHTNRSTTSRTPSPNSVVSEFNVFSKWPLLKQIQYRDTPYQAVSDSTLLYHLAYACLNLRGAICHQQATDCTYQVPVNLIETSTSPQSIPEVWQEAGLALGDVIQLDHSSSNSATTTTTSTTTSNIDAIKDQLTRYGPVISTSFVLEAAYYHHRTSSSRQSSSPASDGGNFSERHIGRHHPVMIVGWTMSEQGPVWLVQALRGPTFSVSMGQFQIERHCIAPPHHWLELKSWQSPGPFWDVPGVSDKCAVWNDHFEDSSHSSTSTSMAMLEVTPLSSTDIEHFCDLWTDGVGLHAVMTERRTFVLRDATKLAQSRRVMVRDVARVPLPGSDTTKRTWKVTLSVVR